jgi:hypothetical protein
MEFNNENHSLRIIFMDEYVRGQFSTWMDFINSKKEDLGIICSSWIGPEYKIVDHKKWTIAKIKYGI